MNFFRVKKELFNKAIKEMINKLNKIINNFEILYIIYNDIIENNNFNNYENLYNLNNFNVENYIKDIDKITINNNIHSNCINTMNI